MSSVPTGWRRLTLGDALETLIDHRGKTPRKLGSDWTPVGVPVISAIHLKHGKIDRSRRDRFVSDEVFRRWMPIPLRAEDVLLTSEAPLGEVALVPDNGPLVLSQRLFALRGRKELINQRFLYHWLTSRAARAQLDRRSSGTTVTGIRQSELVRIKIDLPTIKEQYQIVEILEDHLSRLDAAMLGLEHAVRRIDILEAQTIHATLTGRAVAGPHNVQLHAADLDDGELATLPRGWHWMRLGELADVAGGVTKDSSKQSEPSFIEVPYLRVANVQRGHLDLKEITNIRVPPRKVESLRLLPGDVLLNEGGDRDKLGRGWVWEGQIEICIHQNHVFRARIRDGRIDPYLLSWAANSIGGRWCERNGKQSVNLASISLSKIRLMPVPVPPPNEQVALRQYIEAVVDGCRIMRSEITTSRARSAALRRSLLAAAFAGRLTCSTPGIEMVEELAGV